MPSVEWMDVETEVIFVKTGFKIEVYLLITYICFSFYIVIQMKYFFLNPTCLRSANTEHSVSYGN